MLSPTSPQEQALLSAETESHILDLSGVVVDALRIKPPFYGWSILGKPHTWLPPHRRYSEFTALDLWRPWRTLKTLINVTVPSLPMTPPRFGPPVCNNIFWQPTVVLQRPDHYGSYTSFPDEAWFFVNGIMTNDVIAHINAAYLAYLFHRPITLVQNSTDSALIDLIQCAFGKQWAHTTEPATKAFPAIYDALKSPYKQKVVVIAHSQGTIIMANVLRMLSAITERTASLDAQLAAIMGQPQAAAAPWYVEPEFVYPDDSPLNLDDFDPLEPSDLAKLEIYSFATCANQMRYFQPPTDKQLPIPWIEHFGNEFDIVARLGMQAPRPDHWRIHIEGPRYVHPGAWGHLLNQHYLYPIAGIQQEGRRRGARHGSEPFRLLDESSLPETAYRLAGPRLFQYINGGTA